MPPPHPASVTRTSWHQKKPPLPSLDFSGPKADSFLPEVCFHFSPGKGAPQLQDRSAPSPFPGPSSSSSSARPGLGWRCGAGTETAPLSLHLVTSLGFGLKSSHRRTFILWQSLSPSDLGESHQPPTPPLVCPPVSVHTFQEKHKQQLPGTSANQTGPKFTVASARINSLQSSLQRRAGEIICEEADPEPCASGPGAVSVQPPAQGEMRKK